MWVPASKAWIFADTPSSFQYQYDPSGDGSVNFFRHPTGQVVGSTLDIDGTLLSCEQSGRRVVRMNLATNVVTTVLDKFNESALIAPNDIVVTSTGAIYFSDPDPNDQLNNRVYRVDPSTLKVEIVRTDLLLATGIAFTGDESKAYVVDSDDNHFFVRVFNVEADGKLTGSGTASVFKRVPGVNGVKVDSMGNVWSSSETGVDVFSPVGTKIVEIKAGRVSNLAFGGEDGKTVMLTAYENVWTIPTKVTGAPRGMGSATVQV